MSTARAQSETLGTLLLAAIIILAVTGAGTVAVTNYIDSEPEEPLVNLEAEEIDGNISVAHQGGEDLDATQTTVTLNGTERGALADVSSIDGAFTAGNRTTITQTPGSGLVDVLIVSEEYNAVVLEDQVRLPEPESNFEIASLDAPDSVTAGESIDVDAAIENVGDTEGSQTVRFLVDDEQEDSKEVEELAPDESESVEFEYQTDSGDIGDVEIAVETEQDRKVTDVDVTTRPPEYTITELDVPNGVDAEEEFTANVEVENEGGIEGDVTITFSVDETEEDSETVPIDAGATESVSFDYETVGAGENEISDIPEVDVTVEAGGDDESATVDVDPVPAGDEPYRIDVSNVDEFDFELEAAAGQDGQSGASTGDGGAGGYISGTADVTDVDEVELYVADGQKSIYNGGDGGEGITIEGGDGGGTTLLRTEGGELIAAADGGGGGYGWALGFTAGGGGGARGGDGGEGSSGLIDRDGDDAAGDGNGGSGGGEDTDAGDGSGEINSEYIEVNNGVEQGVNDDHEGSAEINFD